VTRTREINLLALLDCPDAGLDEFLESLVVDI
jgi:hypothetical protein